MKNDPETAIFLLSAGWRSGSTLLQRLIIQSGTAIIWGEAGGALDCFADAFERYRQMLGPGGSRFRHGYGGNGAQQYEHLTRPDGAHHWIASVNPPEEVIREGLRDLLHAIYWAPAKQLGYPRWGVKEVQSGLATAQLLRNFFPSAKFVFLVRNPYDCLLSIKRRNWIDRSDNSDPLGYFATHWGTLAGEFSSADFGYKLRYEDLVASQDTITQLGNYLDIERIDKKFIAKSKTDWSKSNDKPLTLRERHRIKRLLADPMKLWNYL